MEVLSKMFSMFKSTEQLPEPNVESSSDCPMLVAWAGKGKQPRLPEISLGESMFEIDSFDASGDILMARMNKNRIDQDVPPLLCVESHWSFLTQQ